MTYIVVAYRFWNRKTVDCSQTLAFPPERVKNLWTDFDEIFSL